MKIVSIILFFCLVSCQNTTDTNNNNLDQETNSISISKEDIKKIKYIEIIPDSKVEKIISSWEKYNELNRIVLDLKDADLSFFKANKEIVETFNKELKTTIPENVNTPLVMSRIIALETKVFKLESIVNLSNPIKKHTLDAIKELLVAFSNLNLQMNKKLEKESQNIQKPY